MYPAVLRLGDDIAAALTSAFTRVEDVLVRRTQPGGDPQDGGAE